MNGNDHSWPIDQPWLDYMAGFDAALALTERKLASNERPEGTPNPSARKASP